MTRALLWKSWRDYRFVLALLGGSSLLVALAPLPSSLEPFHALFVFASILVVPAIVAWRTVTADGPASAILATLPINTRIIAYVTILAGLCVASIAPLILFIIPRPLHPTQDPALVEPSLQRALATAALVYLCLLILTARVRNRATLCLIAILLLIGYYSALIFAQNVGMLDPLIASLTPLGSFNETLPRLIVAAVVFAMLFLIAARRLAASSRPAPRPKASIARKRRIVHMRKFRWQTGSIAWKSWRELRLLALASPFATLTISIAIVAVIYPLAPGNDRPWAIRQLRGAIPIVGYILSLFFAIALAVTLTSADEPGPALFLAAKPLRRATYLLTRYLAGLAAILFSTALVALIWLLLPDRGRPPIEYEASTIALFAFILEAMAFTIATVVGLFIRQAFLAALAAFGACSLVSALISAAFAALKVQSASQITGTFLLCAAILLAGFFILRRRAFARGAS